MKVHRTRLVMASLILLNVMCAARASETKADDHILAQPGTWGHTDAVQVHNGNTQIEQDYFEAHFNPQMSGAVEINLDVGPDVLLEVVVEERCPYPGNAPWPAVLHNHPFGLPVDRLAANEAHSITVGEPARLVPMNGLAVVTGRLERLIQRIGKPRQALTIDHLGQQRVQGDLLLCRRAIGALTACSQH